MSEISEATLVRLLDKSGLTPSAKTATINRFKRADDSGKQDIYKEIRRSLPGDKSFQTK